MSGSKRLLLNSVPSSGSRTMPWILLFNERSSNRGFWPSRLPKFKQLLSVRGIHSFTASLQSMSPALSAISLSLIFRLFVRSMMIESQARESGFYALNGADRGRLFAPSFFQGTSGIGYTFLRILNLQLPFSSLLGRRSRTRSSHFEFFYSLGKTAIDCQHELSGSRTGGGCK